jgi:hypothetical protein
MFFIRLLPSMGEAVCAGNHKMAAAMEDAVALWDAHGGNEPTVAAAMALHSKSPTPAKGEER